MYFNIVGLEIVDLFPENDRQSLHNLVADRLLFRLSLEMRLLFVVVNIHSYAYDTIVKFELNLASFAYLEKLCGCLTEIADHSLCGVACHRVRDSVQINSTFVRAVHEDIESLDGLGALLLEAEYEVDPLVEMLAHIVALERLAMQIDEVLGRLCPWWQCHVVHLVLGYL